MKEEEIHNSQHRHRQLALFTDCTKEKQKRIFMQMMLYSGQFIQAI